MRARLLVEHAGPLTTIQDQGRAGYMRFGVPRSGPIDRLSFAATHAALGAPAGDRVMGGAALELSFGGIRLRALEGDVVFALAGGDFTAFRDGARLGSWTTGRLRPGERLSVREGVQGVWAYLAFAGRLDARDWLGSAATHALAGLGGGSLSPGQVLELDSDGDDGAVAGAFAPPADASPIAQVRLVLGPQERFFPAEALDALQRETFRTSPRFDRMGMVLDGSRLIPQRLDMISEPLVRGSVQVDGAGVATVLMADHQTTGGYPRIGTVTGADIDRLAQLRSPGAFRFEVVDADLAVAEARRQHLKSKAYLQSLRVRTSLEERLLGANLIGGIVDAEADPA